MPALTGDDDGSGFGVRGESATGTGVVGNGPQWAGVVASSVSGSGVSAFSDSGAGVRSVSNSGTGVSGESVKGTGIEGKSTDGAGVSGSGPIWAGVVASSVSGSGVSAFSDSGAGVLSVSNTGPAVSAESTQSYGVVSVSASGVGISGSSGQAIGVTGASQLDHGVSGSSADGDHAGVLGHNTAAQGGTGLVGQADGEAGIGVSGMTSGDEGSIAVYGANNLGRGVVGVSVETHGVEGHTTEGIGVYGWVAGRQDNQPSAGRGVVGVAIGATGVEGRSQSGAGVWGSSNDGEGVHAETTSAQYAAIAGIQLNADSTGAGIYAEHRGNGPAGYFKGNVLVTGHIEFVGADCAEEFQVDGAVDPGTVMVVASDTLLHPSVEAYDRRVAGVVSGAGELQPGILLGTRRDTTVHRRAVALVGRVYCKADATLASIAVGDLLTTSTTPGHAMKAVDQSRAFGAVLGKALRPLATGQGLIPVLVALQ